MKNLTLLIALLLSSALFAQKKGLGNISFPTSAKNTQAQELFIKGTLLLHSFEYDDAAAEFQKARKLEPGFVMAYWGEAMTNNHPIWMRQDKEAGKIALDKLAATPEERAAKTSSQQEKDWLQAVEILYGDGSKEERDNAYSNHMKKMYKKFPADHEIASFYALSILGTSHNGRDEYKYMQAAAVVEEVYSVNPEHPGALHYLIHSYDDPVHAPVGMRAARRYAEVAPFAAHALHMPSHVFVAMGMWDRVVKSNEESSAAADARRARKKLGVDQRGYHSLHWLEYGYLQQGQFEKARKILSDMERDYQESNSRRAAYHLAVMRAGYLVETGNFDDPATDIEIDMDKLFKKSQASKLFTDGLVALNRKDKKTLENVIAQLDEMAPMIHHDMMPKKGKVTCCSPSYSETEDMNEGTIHAIHIMNMELQALQLRQKGKMTEAIEMLQAAAGMEANMDFMFGPPIIAKPSFELLGELLLENTQADEAITAFEHSLKRAPRRTLSLKGLAAAQAAAGKQREAAATRADLKVSLTGGEK